jgi:hypothetical protein
MAAGQLDFSRFKQSSAIQITVKWLSRYLIMDPNPTAFLVGHFVSSRSQIREMKLTVGGMQQ